MTEAEKQGKPVAGIDAQSPRLGIAEPSLGHQIVEKGVQAPLADVGLFPRRQRVGNGGLFVRKVGGVLDKNAPPAGLLLQAPRVNVL